MAPDGAPQRAALETAAAYAALGLALLPECSATCTCSHPGKRPWDPETGRHMDAWQDRGVPTSTELDAWLASPGAEHLSLGCRCGPGCVGADGLIGADADGERGIVEVARHLSLAPDVLEAAIRQYRESGVFWLNLGTAAFGHCGGRRSAPSCARWARTRGTKVCA